MKPSAYAPVLLTGYLYCSCVPEPVLVLVSVPLELEFQVALRASVPCEPCPPL
jgi:hypothetical protein